MKQVLNPLVWSQSLVSSPSGWEKHVKVRAEKNIEIIETVPDELKMIVSGGENKDDEILFDLFPPAPA